MNRRLIHKLHSRAGETLAETLVGLLISALAIVMLAGAISAGARIIRESETTMQSYYKAGNMLASEEADSSLGDKAANGSATITPTVKLTTDEATINVSWYANECLAGKPVISYRKVVATP